MFKQTSLNIMTLLPELTEIVYAYLTVEDLVIIDLMTPTRASIRLKSELTQVEVIACQLIVGVIPPKIQPWFPVYLRALMYVKHKHVGSCINAEFHIHYFKDPGGWDLIDRLILHPQLYYGNTGFFILRELIRHHDHTRISRLLLHPAFHCSRQHFDEMTDLAGVELLWPSVKMNDIPSCIKSLFYQFPDTAELLLDQHWDQVTQHRTDLLSAVINHRPHLIEKLVQAKLYDDQMNYLNLMEMESLRDRNNVTSLPYTVSHLNDTLLKASYYGDVEVVTTVVDLKADVNVKMRPLFFGSGKNTCTALDMAKFRHRHDVITVLLQPGANRHGLTDEQLYTFDGCNH